MQTIHNIKVSKNLVFYSADVSTELLIPYLETGIKAGFPSPANDYIEGVIDLNKELVKNPDATIYTKVKGLSMIDAGIDDGDVLVIDKSLEYSKGKIAVCVIDGEFTLKRILRKKDKLFLMPANENFKPIEVTETNNFMVWGIVTYIIKKV